MTPSLCVLVPSYRRPAHLRRCLAGLASQDRTPDEVIVVHRQGDAATVEACADAGPGIAVRPVPVERPGVIAAMNAGLRACRAEILAITDDDAVPRRDWITRILAAFEARQDAVAVGGRDLVHGADGITQRGEVSAVGKIQWFGRVVGNHHLDSPPGLREVDVLKGANMAWRRPAIADIGFDERLRGSGAQVHWELALCLAARPRGAILYDSAIVVDHYEGPRFDEDGRSARSGTAVFDAAHNEAFIVGTYLPRRTVLLYTIWAVAFGSKKFPGLALIVFARREGIPISAALRGHLSGIREGLRGR